jgi:hemerythrin superfamily protein
MHPFIQHLVNDHRVQHELGTKLAQIKDSSERERVRKSLAGELLPHMAGEEHSIFPYMLASGDAEAEEGAREAVQEHHVSRLVLREILDLTLDSDVFSAKAAVLSELTKHHTEEEESEHFPWLENHSSRQQLDSLFESYKAAQKEAAGA